MSPPRPPVEITTSDGVRVKIPPDVEYVGDTADGFEYCPWALSHIARRPTRGWSWA